MRIKSIWSTLIIDYVEKVLGSGPKNNTLTSKNNVIFNPEKKYIMWSLFLKEIAGFFSSLTGYIVIIVFLVLSSLFLWVFPGSSNIIEVGISSLRPLFEIAPWIFLFLIPAVSMRAFAEEKKSGTLELLLVRPLSNIQIVLGKYLSAFALSIFALLPTLVFYISVIILGETKGNIDHGATWGSYMGLIFLAGSYAAIGIFSSSLTDNIIVAFILSVFLCFMAYSGFNYLADLFPLGGVGNAIQQLGIEAHFLSMGRGVIDSRDVVYFLSLIALFLAGSNYSTQRIK